ncbi:NPP1 protein [Phytophthora nicotianae]|uniref:NPP1 protein n=1 Tax=Phytophthora nicotianae TaxID=4792 RepID=A0A0W8DRV4_PHYNI|nr:NPP1 protein [Phytophthora nicotianae]
MSDPFYLADILLGRVGVLRSTAESIILELCEAQTKLEPGQASDDALRLAIKNKLERVQTNLKLLRKLVPEFDGKTKPIEGVSQTHRNLMLEYHWKNQVQDMGAKAQAVYLEQLSATFPRLEMLGDVRCPPTPSSLFVPKSHKRGRVFDPFGEKQPATLNEMMDYMMAKNRKLKFFKHAETTRGGRRVIKSIKCEINKEVTVHLSFCPPIPENGPNGESGVAASPMTPSTPTSPAFAGGRLRSTRNKHKKQQQQLVKKKKGDMLTKAKLAAEEATKMEMEELKQRITEAREAIKEQEQARAAGLQVTKYIQRLSIFPYNEDARSVRGRSRRTTFSGLSRCTAERHWTIFVSNTRRRVSTISSRGWATMTRFTRLHARSVRSCLPRRVRSGPMCLRLSATTQTDKLSTPSVYPLSRGARQASSDQVALISPPTWKDQPLHLTLLSSRQLLEPDREQATESWRLL